jgi:hypothetical protein
VKLDDVGAARCLVQTVDILGDDRLDDPQFFQARETLVGIVWHCLIDHFFHASDENIPDLDRIAHEGIDVGIFHRVDFFPYAARASEGRDPAFHRNACPCQGDHMCCRHQVTGRFADQVIQCDIILTGPTGLLVLGSELKFRVTPHPETLQMVAG